MNLTGEGLRELLETCEARCVIQVAGYCVKHWPGDLTEIGCQFGQTTVNLAELARRFDRRVIAVDPWQIGTQNCRGGEYEEFVKRTEKYLDILDVVRLSSLDEEAIALIKARSLCFAYVDGLHTYEACLSDIRTVAHCIGAIAVDDVNGLARVKRAFYDGAKLIGREPFHGENSRAGYLLRREEIDELHTL